MEMSQVTKDMIKRIDQSKSWINSQPAPLKDFKFRTNNSWTAQPVEFLDDSSRVERYGIGFLFAVDDAERNVKARLNVRIKPELTPGAETNETPYVVVYVVDQSTGADETIKWFHIEIPGSYKKCLSYPIDDWYRYWISKALEQGKSGKILRLNMRVSV